MNDKIRKGLIMEGGAMRGMFTCGVIDVMMENHLTFDGAVGVSAGATFGVNYKSHQIGRPIRYNKIYMKDKRYCSLRNLFFTGDIFNVKFCYDTLPHELDKWDSDTFSKDPMEFHVVATDANTGEPVYFHMSSGEGIDLDYIRASASIPMLSRTVKIDGGEYLDGGIADSIPVQYFESKGYNRNVAILTRPEGYVKKPEYLGIAKIVLRKYPEMIRAMERRANMYNSELAYIKSQEDAGNLFVIRPPLDLEMHNMAKEPEQLQKMYDAGRKIMEDRLEELKRYLDE